MIYGNNKVAYLNKTLEVRTMKYIICKVCGMVINEKNYLINGEAIPKHNREDDVLYCPFCGAVHEYFGEDKSKIYNVNSDELDEQTLKILDHAMKLEVFNGDFYKIAAEMAENKEVKRMFEGLSRIEYIHARVHQRLGGFKELPTLSKINYNKYDSDDALLELAAQREKHAVEYYNKYSKEVCHEIIVEVFEALSKVEMNHIHLAEKEHSD
jgi:rubrerythrin